MQSTANISGVKLIIELLHGLTNNLGFQQDPTQTLPVIVKVTEKS